MVTSIFLKKKLPSPHRFSFSQWITHFICLLAQFLMKVAICWMFVTVHHGQPRVVFSALINDFMFLSKEHSREHHHNRFWDNTIGRHHSQTSHCTHFRRRRCNTSLKTLPHIFLSVWAPPTGERTLSICCKPTYRLKFYFCCLVRSFDYFPVAWLCQFCFISEQRSVTRVIASPLLSIRHGSLDIWGS